MEIKYDILEKQLNNGDLKSIYLLYGNEKYLLETALKKIKKRFGETIQGINFVIIDDTNINDLIFNIEVPAFGYDKKLIFVRNSGLFKKDGRKKDLTPIQKNIIDYITQNIKLIEDMNIIIFIEDEIDKNDVFDIINKNGTVCQINELKPTELVSELKKICLLYKVLVDDSTLNYLIEISGTNLQVLINEIRKLIEYAGNGGRINKEDIDNLAIKQIESVIFELTDNLGNKKIDKALDVLDNLIYQKEPIQKILITLYNHFKKLYLCNLAIKLNKDIALSLNLKPNQTFLVTKYKKQLSYFDSNTLNNILYELIDIDYKSKNGLVDIDIALRSVLCRYCS